MSKLSDDIWVTRKCHINAEYRLSQASLTANFVLTTYSVYLVIASIIALKAPLKNFEVVSLSGSVLVLTSSVFIWGLRFSERASQFKSSYLRLHLLMADALMAEQSGNADRVEQIRRQYAEVLQSCENHTEADFRKVCFELRRQKEKTVPHFSRLDCCWYALEVLGRSAGRVFLAVAPAIVLFAWYVPGPR